MEGEAEKLVIQDFELDSKSGKLIVNIPIIQYFGMLHIDFI